MRGRNQTVAHIFETIESLKLEIALLKALVQQAISEEEIGQEILVDAAYCEDIEQEILVDAEIVEDTKPRAKPTKKEQRLEARRRAQDWAKSLTKKRKTSDSTQEQES